MDKIGGENCSLWPPVGPHGVGRWRIWKQAWESQQVPADVPVYPWIILQALMVTSQWAFVLGLLTQGGGTKACFRGPKG